MSEFREQLENIDDVDKLIEVYGKLQRRARAAEKKLLNQIDEEIELLEAYKRIEAAFERLDDLMEVMDRKVADEFPTVDEGSETTKYGPFKVQTKGRKNRRVDREELEDLDLSDAAMEVFRADYRVRKSNLESLSKVNPNEYDKVMEAINVSDGKTSVNVEYQD